MRHLDEGTLQAWLDRERSGLSALERDEISLHLAGCATCRDRLDEVEALSARAGVLLGPSQDEDRSVPPYADVVARAARHRATGRKRSPWVAGGWAASVVAALGVGWMANGLLRTGPVPDVRIQGASERVAPEGGPGTPAPPRATTRTPAAEPPLGTTVDRVEAAPVTATPAPPRSARSSPSPSPSPSSAPGSSASAPEAARRTGAAAGEGMREGAPSTVVSGRVTDLDGRPLEAAQVYVEGTGAGALTNRDGRFQIRLDPAAVDTAGGDLTLTALLIGYGAEHRSFTLDRGDVVADFEMAQQAIALDQVVVTGAPAGLATSGPPEILLAPGGDDATWTETTRSDAEARAGFALLLVPELRVLRIQLQDAAGVVLVRVVQELDDGGVLDMVEARGPLGFDAGADEDGRARAAIRRGGLTVAAAAPLEARALRSLLERLR